MSRMARARAAPVLIVLLGGLVAVGCGGGGSSTTGEATEPNSSISRAEFVSKGNALCVAGDKVQEAKVIAFLRARGLKENEEPSKAVLVEATESVFVPSVQSQIDGLKALGLPSGKEQQVNSTLEGAQEALDRVKEEPELAFAKKDPFHDIAEELHALGLVKCAPNR
jgi:hypothetical protein